MDLRMCPSCQQSVLDDDVQECPFCGAAMDGSGPATKTPAKTTTKSKPAPASKAQPKKKPTAPAKSSPPKDEDPFAVEAETNKKAIPLRRKPTAKISYRVVCPMCDTSGFATKAVAGKEVKCPNPKCLMPVFTAPEIKKEEPKVEKKSIFTPALLGSVGGVVVIIGIFLFFFLQAPAPKPKPIIDPNQVVKDPTETEDPIKKDPVEQVKQPPKISIAKVKQQILKQNAEAVLQRSNNRSKSFCRRLSAETHVELGDIKGAMYQLEKLDNLREGLAFFKIIPLVKIGWYHLANGDRKSAEKIAAQALELAKGYRPNIGRDAIGHTVFLGSLLIALEQNENANSLLQSREKVQKAGLESVRVSMILQDHSYDLDQNYQWLPQLNFEAPLVFAASYGAVVRGHGKQTLAWINSIDNPNFKSNALAGYAAGMSIKDSAFDASKNLNITGLSSEQIQRAVALSLQVNAFKKETKQAASIYAQLQKEISNWKLPAPATIPDDSGIYKGKYQRVSAQVLIAIQTHRLLARYLAGAGQHEQAWKQIEQAIQRAAAIGPSQAQAVALMNHVLQDQRRIQNNLAEEFNITQSVSQRNAYNKFRNNSRQIESDAGKRYQLETALLRDSLKWGLSADIYKSYQAELSNKESANNKTDSNLVKAVEESLLSDLVFSLESEKNLEAVSSLREKFASKISSQPPLKSWLQLQRLVEAGSVKEAVALIEKVSKKLDEPQLELRMACQIARKSSPEKTINWIQAIPNIIKQELAYQLTATLQTKKGFIREYWKICVEEQLAPTKKCSVHLGLIEGLSHTDIYKKEELPESEKQADEKTASN